MPFFETSAKTGEEVNVAFERIVLRYFQDKKQEEKKIKEKTDKDDDKVVV